MMSELENCIIAGTIHEAFTELADDLWSVRGELEYMIKRIPHAVAERQARLVPPPFAALSGVPLVKEAAMRARSHLVTIKRYCDEGTIETCIEVMEELINIRAR